jgi:hypothetical protein
MPVEEAELPPIPAPDLEVIGEMQMGILAGLESIQQAKS